MYDGTSWDCYDVYVSVPSLIVVVVVLVFHKFLIVIFPHSQSRHDSVLEVVLAGGSH